MPDDGLERLKKRLYKEGETFGGRFQEPELPYRQEKVRSEWAEKPPEEVFEESLKQPKFPNMKFFIWIAVIFVFSTAVLAAVYLFGGFGAVSTRNIDVFVSAPQEVAGGDLVRWEVKINNRNNVKLASAELGFRYPYGSRPVNKISGSVLIERIALGEVPADGIVSQTFAAYVFGPENFEAEAEAVLEYRTEGSNAIFEKKVQNSVKIIRSPVGVSISAPQEINSGREVSFEARLVSNASDVIKGLTLDFIYPAGFTFKNAKPQPVEGQNRWVLGDIAPGETRSITVSGVFEGEDTDQKNVTAQVGVLEGKTLSVYGAATHSFAIKKMFIDLAARINSQDAVTVVKTGDLISADILWKNNLLQSVRDVTIEIELSGEAIDERSISVFSGSYRGYEKKAVWSPSSLSDLSLLDPGESGVARFSFRVLDAVALSRKQLVNPAIKLRGEIKPASEPLGFGGADVSGKFELELKVETSLQLSSRGFYYSSILPGKGQLPPKIGQETVYTAVWTLANLSNNASNVAVRASLPAYARWKGVYSPSGESVIYDAAKSEVVWRPGAIKAGVGINQPAREMSFQIGLIPSDDQIGTSPVLLFDILAEGRDDFTGNALSVAESSLTTDISRSDTKTNQTDGVVVK